MITDLDKIPLSKLGRTQRLDESSDQSLVKSFLEERLKFFDNSIFLYSTLSKDTAINEHDRKVMIDRIPTLEKDKRVLVKVIDAFNRLTERA